MEKDETVSDSSPHIANIGRLVEVSAVKAPQLEPAVGSHPEPLPPLRMLLLLSVGSSRGV